MCGPIGDGPEPTPDTKADLKAAIRFEKDELKQAKAKVKANAKYHAANLRERVKGIAALQKKLAKLK